MKQILGKALCHSTSLTKRNSVTMDCQIGGMSKKRDFFFKTKSTRYHATAGRAEVEKKLDGKASISPSHGSMAGGAILLRFLTSPLSRIFTCFIRVTVHFYVFYQSNSTFLRVLSE
jgi:hypothetical protein